jgi:hypothetical protein
MRKTLGFTFLLCLLSGFAYANSVPGDPMMVVDDPSCTPTAANTQTISAGTSSGPIESFTSPDGSGCFGFQIVGNNAFTTLDIQVNQTYASIVCSSNGFLCTPTTLDDGSVTDLFFTECPDCGKNGFPVGALFAVDLSPGGWGANTFYIEANLPAPADNPNLSQAFAPEPSSVLLLSTGVIALAGLRKWIG